MGVLDMNEDFVSFSLAKKLKEKGLNFRTRYGYLPPIKLVLESFNYKDWSKSDGYPAPTISQVLKWLREEKKLHICIGICIAPTFSWDYEIVNLDDDCYIHAECGYDSYEDAASNGISYILDNLI